MTPALRRILLAPRRSGGGDTTPPTLSSATINAAGTSLTLVFSEAVSFGAGGNTGWTISPSAFAATLTYASGVGTPIWIYTISRVIFSAETATDSYTQPGDGVQDAAGNALASIVAGAVTNNSSQVPNDQESYTDLTFGVTADDYIEAAASKFHFPGWISGHGASCNTEKVTITGGAGWTIGDRTMDLIVADFGGTKDLIRITSAPAADNATGGAGYINGGVYRAIYFGDSIVRTSYVSDVLGVVFRAYIALGGARLWKLHNRGIGGRTTAVMLANFAAEVAVLIDGTKLRNVVILNGGTNDLANSVTAATALANLQAIGAAVHAAGAKFIIRTVMNRSDGAKGPDFDTQQPILNAAIRAAVSIATGDPYVFKASAGWLDGMVDAQAMPHAADPTNLTYFGDGLHPTATLLQEHADKDKLAIDAIA